VVFLPLTSLVLSCLQVLVLSGGALVDGGHPHELLKKGSGAFVEMVKETGPESEALLREQAEQAWYRNRRRRLSQTSALVRHTWYGEDDDFSYGTSRDDFHDDFDEDDDEEDEMEEEEEEEVVVGEGGGAGEDRASEDSYDAMVSPDEQDLMVLGTLSHEGAQREGCSTDLCGVMVVETGDGRRESAGQGPSSVDPQSPALNGAALFSDPQSPGFANPQSGVPMPKPSAFATPRPTPPPTVAPSEGENPEEEPSPVLSDKDAQGLV
jgi:hypothetical protein